MNPTKLDEFDNELYQKFRKDVDKYEIRGDERIIIEDWLMRMTLVESVLGLLRKDLIDINGITLAENGTDFEPLFIRSDHCMKLMGLEPPEE